MKKARIFAVVLLLVLVVVCLFACTPPVYEGEYVTGCQVDKSVPVVVKSCNVTLDIVDFPEESGEPQQYRSTATIDYQFYNPTDSDVDIPLHMPIDKNPYWSNYDLVFDTPQLTVDGNPVNVVTRCWYGNFTSDYYDKNNEFLLPDSYLQDDYFNDDLVIYKYLYKVELPFDDDRQCVMEYTLDENDKVVINREITDYQNHYFADTVSYYTLVKSNDIITAYSFGKQLSELKVNITETRDGDKIGNVALEQIAEIETTFEEVALMYYNPNGGFVSTDWYNSVLKKLQRYGVSARKSATQFDVTDDVRTWYDYTITVPSHGTVNHSVTMPVFPFINYDYTPDVYEYIINLDNLKKYAEVSAIEIVANTDFYAVRDTQTTITVSDLNQQYWWELSFSSVAEPSSGAPSYESILAFVILVNVLPEAIALAIVIIVAVKTDPKKRKQANEQTTQN